MSELPFADWLKTAKNSNLQMKKHFIITLRPLLVCFIKDEKQN